MSSAFLRRALRTEIKIKASIVRGTLLDIEFTPRFEMQDARPRPSGCLCIISSIAGCKACGKSVEESLVEQLVRIKTLGGDAHPGM